MIYVTKPIYVEAVQVTWSDNGGWDVSELPDWVHSAISLQDVVLPDSKGYFHVRQAWGTSPGFDGDYLVKDADDGVVLVRKADMEAKYDPVDPMVLDALTSAIDSIDLCSRLHRLQDGAVVRIGQR